MAAETYNPWTIVNLVFTHLAEQGLHPTLGAEGHPGEPAAALLRAFGIVPAVEGDARVQAGIHDELAALRARLLDIPPAAVLSQIETRVRRAGPPNGQRRPAESRTRSEP